MGNGPDFAILKPRGVIQSPDGDTVMVDALRRATGATVDLVEDDGGRGSPRSFGFSKWRASWVPTGPTPPRARTPENN